MLVRLFGKNFRLFKSDFELSMVAADARRGADHNRGVIEVPIAGTAKPLRLLRTVAIFGPNASGKSTVLAAGHALRLLGTDSSAYSKPGDRTLAFQPFLLDLESKNAPIELGCEVVHDGSLMTYAISYDSMAIQSETLTIFRDGDFVKLIDRDRSCNISGEVVAASRANQLYVQDMQPNVSVLSKLAQHGPQKGEESVLPYYKTIRNATQHRDYSSSASGYTFDSFNAPQNERFADDAKYREWIMHHLIRAADVGICGVQTDRKDLEITPVVKEIFARMGDAFRLPDKAVVISFLHEGDVTYPILFSEESSGTKKLLSIAGDWWQLANTSHTLLADELSASIHPRLLDRLIRAVNDAPLGRVPSQVVFATHDTGLLEGYNGLPPALRKDQVYFTKKDAKGVAELYSLVEFKDDARPVHNIRKRYLSGLYGALPLAEKISL